MFGALVKDFFVTVPVRNDITLCPLFPNFHIPHLKEIFSLEGGVDNILACGILAQFSWQRRAAYSLIQGPKGWKKLQKEPCEKKGGGR